MKTVVNEYLKVVMYVIFGILLVMSSYLIILNINHANSLSYHTIVSEADNDYTEYKKNVNKIESFINQYEYSSESKYHVIQIALDSMKKSGVYRLIPKMELSAIDLYELNDYFMEELINNSWVSNIKQLDISNKYDDTIMLLVNNSNYLQAIINNNSLVLYDNNLDNKIEDNYYFLLNNYLMYSKVILNLCNEIGGESG